MNKLNHKIEKTEKEILERKRDLNLKRKVVDISIYNMEHRLELKYKKEKIAEYSNADKRHAIALTLPEHLTSNEEIANEDYELKILEIELSALKREFRILEKEAGECSSLKTIAINLKRIADILEEKK